MSSRTGANRVLRCRRSARKPACGESTTQSDGCLSGRCGQMRDPEGRILIGNVLGPSETRSKNKHRWTTCVNRSSYRNDSRNQSPIFLLPDFNEALWLNDYTSGFTAGLFHLQNTISAHFAFIALPVLNNLNNSSFKSTPSCLPLKELLLCCQE